MDLKLHDLKQRLSTIEQMSYSVHSRIHRLQTFPSSSCYVKREDELGFSISGSKIRKYRSLIPFLLANTIQEVALIGSAYSNHVLSFSQLLIENGMKPTLFLRGDPKRRLQGNALLTTLFISPSSIHWISQSEWKEVENIAHDYAKKKDYPILVLPEGGFHTAALPGALSLPLDVLDNQEEYNIEFDHIFIDAGTGFMASALILGLHQLNHRAHIHVLLLADDEKAFEKRLNHCHQMFCNLMGRDMSLPRHFTLHRPSLAKGFGQMNSFLFKTIAEIAQTEGFLTDPIYSAKLFMESKRLIKQDQIEGNVLIHHSGGALTLMGFQHQLANQFLQQPSRYVR